MRNRKKETVKKEYLETYLTLYYRVLNYKDEIQKIVWEEAQPSGIDYSADKVQTSPSDGMLGKVLRIESRKQEYIDLITKCNDQMQMIVDSVNAIPDGEASRVLYLRYIKNHNWDDIGNELGFDPVYTRGTLHGQAIEYLKVNPQVIIIGKNLHKTT